MMEALTIRPLTADDSFAYRALRRRILEIGDGKYFSTSYTREDAFTRDEQWREWCTENKDHCTIGTFLNSRLIGIMGIVRYGAPEDKAVEWEATWLEPSFRKCGIAKLAYDYVYRWTANHGYQYVVVMIRSDNQRSREIRERQGAVYMLTQFDQKWADGSVCDVDYFIMDISKFGQGKPPVQDIQCLRAVFALMEHEPPILINDTYSPLSTDAATPSFNPIWNDGGRTHSSNIKKVRD